MASEPTGWAGDGGGGGIDAVVGVGASTAKGAAGVPAAGSAAGVPAAGGAERRALARRRVRRFSVTERWLHAVNGVAFIAMLLTGLALFLPVLAQTFGNRPVVKAIHLAVASLWLTAIVLAPILGDRRALRRARQQFESLSAADLRWMRSRAARAAPQGKFNGGQKFHAVLQGALTFLFFVSGTLLYLGERNTAFRLPGTIALHDAAMVIGVIFVAGHIRIACSRQSRASLSGMVDGTVPATYAAEHHARWNPAEEPAESLPRIGVARGLVVLAVLGVGIACAALLAGA